MKILGHKHLSWNYRYMRYGLRGQLNRVKWVTTRFSSFDDQPWNMLEVIPELMRWYPNAYYILLARDPEEWFASDFKFRKPWHAKQGTKEKEIKWYSQRNQVVRDLAQNEKVRFTELSWGDGDGWDDLCGFLECEIPDVAFPWIKP